MTGSTNGCTSQSSVIINVVDCLSAAEFEASQFELFPNPADQIIHLKFNSNADRKIIIRAYTGQVVAESFQTDSNFSLDISSLSVGAYLIEIIELENGHFVSQKILIE